MLLFENHVEKTMFFNMIQMKNFMNKWELESFYCGCVEAFRYRFFQLSGMQWDHSSVCSCATVSTQTWSIISICTEEGGFLSSYSDQPLIKLLHMNQTHAAIKLGLICWASDSVVYEIGQHVPFVHIFTPFNTHLCFYSCLCCWLKKLLIKWTNTYQISFL